MNAKFKFQYSILRYRHDLITGEFINVGLVLFSSEARYFKAKMLNRYKRVTATFPRADGEFLKSYLDHLQFEFDVISEGIQNEQLNLFADSKLPEALGGLLSKVLPHDDSSVYFEKPQFGLVEDLEKFFYDLYDRMVLHYMVDLDRDTRNDEDIWDLYRKPLLKTSVLSRLQRHIVRLSVDEYKFDHAWKNGKWKVLQPVSFDLKIPTNIRKKAREWVGATFVLKEEKNLGHLYFLLGAPSLNNPDLIKAYNQTKEMLSLKQDGLSTTLIEENEAEDFANHISPIIERETDNISSKE